MDKSREYPVGPNSTMTSSELVAGAIFLILFIVIGAIICHLLGIEPPHEVGPLPWMVK